MKTLSRQRQWQIKMHEQGCCTLCGAVMPENDHRQNCAACAAKAAQRRGKATYKRHLLPADWQAVDWSRLDREIAAELNVCSATVRHQRAIHAPEELRDLPQCKSAVVLRREAVDWSLNNDTLAQQLGMHPVTVSRLRQAHAPEPYRYTSRGRPCRRAA